MMPVSLITDRNDGQKDRQMFRAVVKRQPSFGA